MSTYLLDTRVLLWAAGAPPHRDPCDRMLRAQAYVEGLTLFTADRLVAQYPGPVERIRVRRRTRPRPMW